MKTVSIRKHGKNPNLNTKNLIISALENPTEGGFSVTEMRNRLKVMDKVDALNEESTVLELEDAEFETVKNAVKQVKWAILDKFIVEFEDSFN